VYGASLIPAESLGYEVDGVLTALMEPLLRACRLSAEGLDPSDAAVLMLNNVAALQVPGEVVGPSQPLSGGSHTLVLSCLVM
jgi:hypothetical protein